MSWVEYQAVKEDRKKSHFSNWKWWQGSRWKKWKLVTTYDDAIQWRRGLEMCFIFPETGLGENFFFRFLTLKIRGLFLMLLNMRSSHLKSLAWRKGDRHEMWQFHKTRKPSNPIHVAYLPNHIILHIKKRQNFFSPSFSLSILTTFIFSSAHKRSKHFVRWDSE